MQGRLEPLAQGINKDVALNIFISL